MFILTTPHAPAIIIGGGSANGLGIARNLGSHGVPIYCLTSNPHEVTLFSKFCSHAAVIPDVEHAPRVLCAFLARLARQISRLGVLFPTTDTALLTLAGIMEELPQYVSFIPDREVVETMVIKSQFYHSLREHGIPHPHTITHLDKGIERSLRDLTYPVFIRPTQSLVFYQKFGTKGFIAQDPEQVRLYVRIARGQQIDVMLQEIIPGSTRNGFALHGYMDQRGRVLALIGYQKMRQPSLFSNSIINRTIPLAQLSPMKETLITYLQAIGYRGLFGAEFKRDPRDGQLKLLEINARSLGGNYFAAQCGINDVFMAYRDALGEEVMPVAHYATNVYKIKYLLDVPLVFRQLWTWYRDAVGFHPYIARHVGHIHLRSDALPFLHALRAALTINELTQYIGGTKAYV